MSIPPYKKTKINEQKSNKKLQEIAKKFESKYNYPQYSRDGDIIELSGRNKFIIKVSNSRDYKKGKWVLIVYNSNSNKYSLQYNKNGTSGSSEMNERIGQDVNFEQLNHKISKYLTS